MTTITTDLRGKRWDIIETVGVPITVSVTATDPAGQPITYPGVIAFRVYDDAGTIQTEALVNANVASATVLDGNQSATVGVGSTRWAMVDTQTGDEYLAGYIILADPGVARREGNTVTDVAVMVGPNDITLTGVIIARTVDTGGGGVTDPEVVRDTVATFLQAGLNVVIQHDDAANTLSISIPTVTAHLNDIDVHIEASANTEVGDIPIWNGEAWAPSANRADALFAEVSVTEAMIAGTVVKQVGWQGNRAVVSPALSTDVPFGVVSDAIDVNSAGSIVVSGNVYGFGTSEWPIGTHLWPTTDDPGGLTDTPVSGAHAVAIVIRQGENGAVKVLPYTYRAP